MTVHLVTFSDESMSRSARLCTESADRNGVSECWIWTPQSVGTLKAAAHHPEVFYQPDNPKRAWAHWAFKPAIILEHLNMGSRGTAPSYVIYSDAGIEFIDNVSHIMERMDQDIFLFGNNWEHAHWCKADVPTEILGKQRISADGVQNWLWQDHPKHDVGCACRPETIIFGKQVQASVIFFRVSDYTRSFVAEWLKWCLFEGGRLIDDSPSRLPNHPEFREHRHDQAILTTLAYREGIKLHYWPAVYNKGGTPEFLYEQLPEYAGDSYPCLFSHHRKRDREWVPESISEVQAKV